MARKSYAERLKASTPNPEAITYPAAEPEIEPAIAEKPMHTAVDWFDSTMAPRGSSVEFTTSQFADNGTTGAISMTTDHSNPDPRKNSIVSNVHVSNMSMRLESENAILRAQVDVVDRKIAELQAERTDLTGAIAMNNAALNASENL